MKAVLSKRDEKYLKRSLNDTMWKVVLMIGTPLALYQGVQQIFSILDTMMAAHISKESVYAVAYLSQLNHLLSAVGGGLAVGASIQISRAFGEGDVDLVHKRVSSLYALSFSVGMIMLAAILPVTNQFLKLAVPLGINASVMALLYGLGKTKLTLIINLARVFVFHIPVFWFLQNCTDFGQASVGIVMIVSNISVAVLSSFIAWIVIREYKNTYNL